MKLTKYKLLCLAPDIREQSASFMSSALSMITTNSDSMPYQCFIFLIDWILIITPSVRFKVLKRLFLKFFKHQCFQNEYFIIIAQSNVCRSVMMFNIMQLR